MLETFRTSYRRDFAWPWALPVQLYAWRPPERTLARPREGPPPPPPDCLCPEHSWALARGPEPQPEPSDLEHYMCLASKEARLHQRAQAVRQEIQRCINRTRDAEVARRSKFPPLPGGEEWRTIYASDYTQKGLVPRMGFVDVLTELVSTGVPRAPLGRSLFADYDDPTRFRESPFTVPVYDPARPVARPAHRDIWELWYSDFPGSSEYTASYSRPAEETARRAQPFKYPLPPRQPVDHLFTE
ncbi:Succinate--CoA ligase [ADP-forming] subunit beta [Frankliniella fusca]|uniref:Succinate--CoA ligase [ADP-forming] subunit beta n=1 Tax=Frankliniella fusca TaxID=407009 RepID=A0AAE1H9W4_9NEOP|nr:Succinate--CoA ligase [ADP-forming] subunit beta [Frankliniella fusca]